MAKTELKDKKMKCSECQGEFIFTKGEQAFFLQKAFAEPKRCEDCRKTRKKGQRQRRRQLLKSLKTTEDVTMEMTTEVSPQSSVTQEENVKVGIVENDSEQSEAKQTEHEKQQESKPEVDGLQGAEKDKTEKSETQPT